MIVTLENGTRLEGTPDEIAKALKGLTGDTPNPDLWYYSESHKTYILISEMDINHLRNALLKHYADWVEALHKLAGKELVKAIGEGPAEHTVIVGLLKALAKR